MKVSIKEKACQCDVSACALSAEAASPPKSCEARQYTVSTAPLLVISFVVEQRDSTSFTVCLAGVCKLPAVSFDEKTLLLLLRAA